LAPVAVELTFENKNIEPNQWNSSSNNSSSSSYNNIAEIAVVTISCFG
jgi:hypothetical protein